MAKPEIDSFQELLEQELYNAVHSKGQHMTTTEWAMNQRMEIIVKLLVKIADRVAYVPIDSLLQDIDDAITRIENEMALEEDDE
jgi:hypothetical protein